MQKAFRQKQVVKLPTPKDGSQRVQAIFPTLKVIPLWLKANIHTQKATPQEHEQGHRPTQKELAHLLKEFHRMQKATRQQDQDTFPTPKVKTQEQRVWGRMQKAISH